MGLTAMDLFNDILTQENDLKNFLTQSDVKQNQVSTSNPGLIIQGRNSRTIHPDLDIRSQNRINLSSLAPNSQFSHIHEKTF